MLFIQLTCEGHPKPFFFTVTINGSQSTHMLDLCKHQAQYVNCNLGPRESCYMVFLWANQLGLVIAGSICFDGSQLFRVEGLKSKGSGADINILKSG